ncbi:MULTISPECIES: serine/threonine-protein kinase [Streptomyces]|uniref:non-specific serine/threonine protein kinase n=1 Tax=Streptomyces solicathayae TaxID=3081768 RepID=A0ABZ0M0J3_9ACTN|nr:serine/threonine-protein kinase [Streptomyces sp. HUAS YS2]WOX25271.1 serine/threonine-protein kinase [Streptomyces sp. HUAS YS2]
MSGASPEGDRLIAGRYRLLGALGEGGMGVVWRARDEVLGREVAVKEVRAPAGLAADDVRRLYARLEREAWAAARIPHRNVVTVYDVVTEDGRPWIVMELVRGLSLSEALDAEGPMPPQRAARIGAEVLQALRAAHEAGVLHRDVKPGNVLLANDGRVVLTDFGIALVEGSSNLTMTGELVGSPEFLAPERALGRATGPASDLWSLGVLLYAAVEGNSPFRQDTPLSTLRAVVDEELPPPRRAGALTPVIEGLLRKEPDERLSAREAAEQLRVIGAGGAPRTGPIASGQDTTTVMAGTRADGNIGPTRAGPPQPPPPGGPDTPTPAGEGPGRPRRAVATLAAGIAVLLLAVGGLTYTLLREDDPGGTGGTTAGSDDGGTSAGTATAGGGTSAPPTTPPATTPPATTPPATGHGTTAPPKQTVTAWAKAVRGSYSGTCPAPAAEAPAFTATIGVGNLPATVEYRWATESGTSSAGGWKTLEFAADGAKQRQVEHTELTYEAGGTRHDRIRVEVRNPVEVRSNWVAFSVTCEEATPTGGATYPTGSVTPRF